MSDRLSCLVSGRCQWLQGQSAPCLFRVLFSGEQHTPNLKEMRFPEIVKSQVMSAALDGSLACSGSLAVCDLIQWIDPFEVFHLAGTQGSRGLWTQVWQV